MRAGRTAVAAAALLAASSAALLALSPRFVPPMDDTWIHLVYGRSLLSSSPLCFNAGQPSAGFTSPLWLLPAALASIPGEHSTIILMAMSLAAAAAALLVPGLPVAAPLLALTGPFLLHSSSGMETGLACFLIAMSWVRLSAPPSPGRDGILLAASGLCRPEFFLLMVPYVIRLIRPGRSGLRGLPTLIGPSALLGSAWILWNLAATGHPLPASLYAKAGAPPALLLLGRGLLISSPLTVPLGLVAAGSMLRRGRLEGSIPLVLLAAALATQPNPWFQMRYYTPFLFACGLAAAAWLERFPGGTRRVLLVASVVLAFPGLVFYGRNRILASMDVLSIDVEPALFLREVSGGRATVACADAGAMKWLGGFEILDVDGLVTPGLRDPAGEALEDADYAALFPLQYEWLIEEAGSILRPLELFRSSTPVICGEDAVQVFELVRDPGAGGS